MSALSSGPLRAPGELAGVADPASVAIPEDGPNGTSRPCRERPKRKSSRGLRAVHRRNQDMDELIKDLQERGLAEEEAKVAALYIFELMRDEERRKKVVLAATATTIASAVVTGAI